jgi:2-polyprenyl-6-methoxyphenol hydroxylase-like FAD-dependent oxidoreductase
MIYDALIVGFGPVGATMANLLVRYGLRAAVV